MSAFYDQASLVVVPSGYKSGKIYAQKPLTTDGQLTFTRASTATRVNASGLIETVSSGVPRLDYLGSTCPKILLEPQRSNAMIQSSALNAAFSSQNAAGTGAFTITENYAAAPDGTTTADRIQMSATSGGYVDILYPSFTPSTGTVYTYSVYIKSLSGTPVIGFLYDGTVTRYITTSTNWTRHTFTFTGGAAAYPRFLCEPPSTSTSADILVWGWQMEAGAYATSYIPTTSAAVTRLADAASKTGITSLIGQAEGTFFYDFVFSRGMASYGYVSLENAATSNRIRSLYVASSNTLSFDFIVSNASLGNIYSFTPVDGTRYKIAWGYKNGDTAIYINGTQVGTSTAAIAFTDLSVITFDNPSAPTQQVMAGKYNQALLFKTRLTNAQLAELTTL